MVGMGVRRMGVAVIKAVVMGEAVVMGVAVRNGASVRLAGSGAFPLAEGAAFLNSFDVMVVTFLGSPDVLLEPQNLGAVFAE